jgi:hypothetical protein
MSKGLTKLLVEQIENTIADVPPSVVVQGIVSEIGLTETVSWLTIIAKQQGYTLTLERRI